MPTMPEQYEVKTCPHVRLDDSIPVTGLANRDGSLNWSCAKCTVDRWRRAIGHDDPEEILENVFLDDADVRGILHELLAVVKIYVTGAKTVKKFDPLKPKPVQWQVVRMTSRESR